MMRRKLTIDRAPGGGWVVVEVATGVTVAGPFRSRVEAEMVWAELRDTDRCVTSFWALGAA